MALQSDTKGVLATHKWSKFNGTYQRQVCVYDVNLLKENIPILTKNTGALLVSSKLVVLETKTEDTKYVFVPHEQNAEKNHNVNIGNKLF